MKKTSILFYCLLFILTSCDHVFEKKRINSSNHKKTTFVTPTVKVSEILSSSFQKEMYTNANISAKQKINLKFLLNEKIIKINVKNGQKVIKGEIIAKQDHQFYINNLQKSKEQLERAVIDIEDILLGFGYSLNDSINNKIPKKILKIAKNRANFNNAKSEFNNAEIKLRSTILKAPFSGIIANLETKMYSYPDNTKPFCTLINDKTFDVNFSILEENYNWVFNEQKIIVTINNGEKILGKITEINPIVNQDGMINIKGKILNKGNLLIDGMNVSVKIVKSIKNVLSVPKEAIVLRDTKKVVFTYKGGKAIWNYVETSYENTTHIVIIKGLSPKDSIIFTNNTNLAHNIEVQLENDLQ